MAQNMQGTVRLELCPCPTRAWGYVGSYDGAKWDCPCRMGACKQGQPAPRYAGSQGVEGEALG